MSFYLFVVLVFTTHATTDCLIVGSDTVVSRQAGVTFPDIDSDNEMRGFVHMDAGFTLGASTTTCLFNALFPVSGDITLNGGTLTLQEDMHMSSDVQVVTVGTITGTGQTIFIDQRKEIDIPEGVATADEFIFDNVSLSYDAAVTLKNLARFKGVCTIEGNNNPITLVDNGAIVVDPGAQLTIRNVIVEGVSGNNVRITDSTGSITFDSVELIQSGNTTFDNGLFQVKNRLSIQGPYTFSYKSDQISTVLANSMIKLNTDTTLKYDPVSGRNLLQFIDSTSLLLLSGATFSASIIGLDLLKGTLVVDEVSYISSDATQLSESITFGDGAASSNNMDIYNPGGTLEITNGYVQCNNV